MARRYAGLCYPLDTLHPDCHILVRLLSSPSNLVLNETHKTASGNSPFLTFPSGAQVMIVDSNFQNIDCMRYATSSTSTLALAGWISASSFQTFCNISFSVKLRLQVLRDLGSTLDPFGAFLLQGLEMLSLRAQRRLENALALALYLEQHEKVAWVSYIGPELHPSHQLAPKTLRRYVFGGIFGFGVKGDDPSVSSKVVDSLRLSSNLMKVGDAKTL